MNDLQCLPGHPAHSLRLALEPPQHTGAALRCLDDHETTLVTSIRQRLGGELGVLKLVYRLDTSLYGIHQRYCLCSVNL